MKTRMGCVALLTVGVTLAAGGCSSDTADGEGSAGTAESAPKSTEPASAGPSQALVKWAGDMCEATERFKTTKANSAIGIKGIADPLNEAPIGAELIAIGYLWDTSSSLDKVAKGLANVGARSSGIATADRLHDRMTKEVARVRPMVTALTGSGPRTGTGEDSVGRAERVGELIASLRMPEPDLTALAARQPKLSAAYRTAPECAPPERLPTAADGTDAGACEDGACEILVRKQTHLAIGEWQVRVSLSETKATVRNNDPAGAVGEVWLTAGGTGSFGEADGRELAIKAVAVGKDGAVLKFRTK
ncbi:hypothetical protein [Streptomyces niveus]|uniref:hypothetical protein n=1 Tax=Streptomyces niveus TaxID=193462 RepID=UPI0036AFCB42